MKKIYFAIVVTIFSLIHAIGFSQIEQGGLPLGIQNPQLSLNPLVFESMPAIDIDQLLAEDAINDKYNDIPWRFGENIEVKLNPNNSGSWDVFPKGDKVWRLGIKCPGAFTINLTFDNYHLPPGAKLFVYNTEQTHIIGAFTDFNNQEDKLFATTLVKGDEIIIEYYEPPLAEFKGELNLSQVTHGYRDAYGYAKSFGQSGSCNGECGLSSGSRNGKTRFGAFACLFLREASGFCSGALINNTANDGKPYVLSADHCYSAPGSVVYWFNWQSPTCSNPASSPPYNSMSGATQRARNSTSDFGLVELLTTIPSNYNVYFSGWNRTTDNYISGKIWGIHHPSGDIEKDKLVKPGCFYYHLPFEYRTWQWHSLENYELERWNHNRRWVSGSPVFDPAGKIIGQLHGGYAS